MADADHNLGQVTDAQGKQQQVNQNSIQVNIDNIRKTNN